MANTYTLKYAGNEIDSKLAAVDKKVGIDEFNNRYDALKSLVDAKDLEIEIKVQNLTNDFNQTSTEIDTSLQSLRDEVSHDSQENELKFFNHQKNIENLQNSDIEINTRLNTLTNSIDELNSKGIDVINTASGSKIRLKDSLESRIKGLKMYGKSTPTKLYIGDKEGIITLSITNADGTQTNTYDFNLGRGLYGIPVDKKGDYTDTKGQSWICDILDFNTLTLTKKIRHITLNGSSEEASGYTWGSIGSGENAYFYLTIGEMHSVKNHKLFSKTFNQASIAMSNTNLGLDVINSDTYEDARILFRPGVAAVEPGNVESLKAWLKENITYVLVMPTEVEVESLVNDKGLALEQYQDLLNVYNSIMFYQPYTIITAANGAYMEVSYSAINTKQMVSEYVKQQIDSLTDLYCNPVTSVWEQKMLDRLNLFLIPTTAMGTVVRAYGAKEVKKDEILTGVNYSSVGGTKEAYYHGLVGVQTPLKTYYSAMANPASIIYTAGDVDTEARNISTYYGVTCSSLVSFISGFPVWVYTQEMGGHSSLNAEEGSYTTTTWPDLQLQINNPDDLFKIQRGDIMVNTLNRDPATVTNGHVKIISDLVYQRDGRLAGFNVAEATKPCVKITFYGLEEFFEQLQGEEPYYVLRFDKTNLVFDLTENDVTYSTSVMPNKGDKSLYYLNTSDATLSEPIELYIPDTESQTLHYSFNGVISSNVYNLEDLSSHLVNGVTVYDFIPVEGAGEYVLWVDNHLTDPTSFTVITSKPRARDGVSEINKNFILNPPAYQSEYDKLIAELEKLKNEGA